MVLLKICGLTRSEDVELVDSVADYAGFIIDPYTASPRRVDPVVARDLASVLSRARPVAVFDRLAPKVAVALAAQYDFPVAQVPEKFGEEVEEEARESGVALAPVVLYGRDDVMAEVKRLAERSYEYILVDAIKESKVRYEHGLRVPLDLMRQAARVGRVGLAGGITPDNVGFVLELAPYMIDVASGVESSPGVKDREKVLALASKVKMAR